MRGPRPLNHRSSTALAESTPGRGGTRRRLELPAAHGVPATPGPSTANVRGVCHGRRRVQGDLPVPPTRAGDRWWNRAREDGGDPKAVWAMRLITRAAPRTAPWPAPRRRWWPPVGRGGGGVVGVVSEPVPGGVDGGPSLLSSHSPRRRAEYPGDQDGTDPADPQRTAPRDSRHICLNPPSTFLVSGSRGSPARSGAGGAPSRPNHWSARSTYRKGNQRTFLVAGAVDISSGNAADTSSDISRTDLRKRQRVQIRDRLGHLRRSTARLPGTFQKRLRL
jgi:hypothetical protein